MDLNDTETSRSDMPRRRSMRLQRFDYAENAAYFVTICAAERRCLFGEIEAGVTRLSAIGRMVEEAWRETAAHRPGVIPDTWVVMPNHFHGIVVLPGITKSASGTVLPSGPARNSLGAVIGEFKTAASREVIEFRLLSKGPLWQRGYHDHIIRHDRELDAVRKYILDNPARWADDPDHPQHHQFTSSSGHS